MGALFFFETDLGVAFEFCSDLFWTWIAFSPPTYLSRPVGL